MNVKGYLIKYSLKTSSPKESYVYQRFFRALYGYTQVVSKSNGRKYVYYREGVLTRHPYIKKGKKEVVVPNSALNDLVNFFRTGKNPAHSFQDVSVWQEQVSYSIEEVFVNENDVVQAIIDALSRVMVHLPMGTYFAKDLILNYAQLNQSDLYTLYSAVYPIISSDWYKVVRDSETLSFTAPFVKAASDIFS